LPHDIIIEKKPSCCCGVREGSPPSAANEAKNCPSRCSDEAGGHPPDGHGKGKNKNKNKNSRQKKERKKSVAKSDSHSRRQAQVYITCYVKAHKGIFSCAKVQEKTVYIMQHYVNRRSVLDLGVVAGAFAPRPCWVGQ